MKKRSAAAAFSLVELTLALGIAAFCLIAVFGLVPVGVQTNRNATSQTAATNILSSVISDLRATTGLQTVPSTRYQINRTKLSSTTVCFDAQAAWIPPSLPGNQPCPANSRYRLYVKMANNPDGVVYPNYADLKVVWPAAVNPLSATVKPSGSVEMVSGYFVQ